MHQLPALISDLALILIVAGVVTVVFRWLKQPLVLGYIVAGLLAGPHVGLIPTIADTADIAIWADIGVVFLLFALGLEFSFKKLVRVGKTGIITAVTEVVAMFLVGLLVGRALHWSPTDSMFLGGMLSMSSTTIIIKAFDDLHVREERFATQVFGVLVVEDLVAVLLMVLLSTVAVNQHFSGAEMIQNLLKLVFFLMVCFVGGVFLVPTLLKKVHHLMNDETLLVVCVGLCLVMVVLAVAAGFSSALGAFMMGSILAETTAVERIERQLKPVKDLFGAVFFVSVGMMISPQILFQYAGPVALVTLATLIGKFLCSSGGMLLSGQSLKVSLQSGCSLAQIGEFAFIIASLGQSLQVTSEFLYPVVVAVSVITTFFTPYLIRVGEPLYHLLERTMPDRLRSRWCGERAEKTSETPVAEDEGWTAMLRRYVFKFMLLAVILYAIMLFSFTWLVPWLEANLPAPYAHFTAAAGMLLVMAPFLRAMMYGSDYQPSIVINLWVENACNRLVLSLLMMIRLLAAFACVLYVLMRLFAIPPAVTIAIAVVLLFVSAKSKKLLKWYWHIESQFLVNLNERQVEAMRQREQQTGVRNAADVEARHWLDTDLFVVGMMLKDTNGMVGKALKNSNLRTVRRNVFVIRVHRWPDMQPEALEQALASGQMPQQGLVFNMPDGDFIFSSHDLLYLAGERSTLLKLQQHTAYWQIMSHSMRSLREFSRHETSTPGRMQPLMCVAVSVEARSGLLHANLRDSVVSKRTRCLLIGLERNGQQIINPVPDTTLQEHDVIWVIGEEKPVIALIERNVF